MVGGEFNLYLLSQHWLQAEMNTFYLCFIIFSYEFIILSYNVTYAVIQLKMAYFNIYTASLLLL